MTFHQYTSLDDDKQAKVLWSDGANISERDSGPHTIFLYQICAFYVEVVYDNATNEIEGLRLFEDTELLEPYLHDIEIPELH